VLKSGGKSSPLSFRQEYLPVVFFEPATNVAPMVGLDLAAERAFVAERFARVNAAFDDDIGVLIQRETLHR
jgi:hypothetical protein